MGKVEIYASVHKKRSGGTFELLKKPLFILLFLLSIHLLPAQQVTEATFFSVDSLNNAKILGQYNFNSEGRQKAVLFSLTGAYGGTMLLLNEAWYKQYSRTAFHVFNDSREWLQVDKLGHGWSAYQLTRASSALWQWAGTPQKQSVVRGGAGSLFFLTLIEVMDAYSQKWGWSWADMAANVGGVLLFAGQELHWREQRIQYKFSVVPHRYPADLTQRATELFGASLPEKMLKDYNNQTYWLSVNPKSFFPESALPSWFNISAGYGASGMWGGFANKGFDHDGNITFSRTDIRRMRQWYLAPDVDFTRIKTKRKSIKTALFLLNCLKFPTPALERSGKKWRAAWVQ